MTPEDTPRMAERTDRQPDQSWLARIRAGLEAHDRGDLNPNADMFAWESVAYLLPFAALLRERDAQIASLDAHIERQNTFIGILDKRIVDSGVAQEALGSKLVMAESVAKNNYDACERARAERDAAQQERDGWRKAFGIQTTSGWTTPEAMKERHDDAWRRYQERGTALQQENKTLREALEEVTEHLESQRDIQLNNGYPEEYAAIGKARAALSSSPRPQEPQPAEPKSSETRKPVVNLMEALKKSLDSLNAKPSQEPGGHQP